MKRFPWICLENVPNFSPIPERFVPHFSTCIYHDDPGRYKSPGVLSIVGNERGRVWDRLIDHVLRRDGDPLREEAGGAVTEGGG